jgi:predicted DNA-binding mobile mystery protein A
MLSPARQQLDLRLAAVRGLNLAQLPHRGWIRAIRDALGMTAAQLAKRMGVKQSTVSEYEKGETARTITLETLERAAAALGCRLVYVLVPERSLESLIRERAQLVARNQLQRVANTMRLEDQQIGQEAEARQLDSLVEKLIVENPGSLWTEL